MTRIKAIPTMYKGHQMRSKLEARVAAQLDFQGIAWMYEVEGYDLDGVWYLPDFWLPDLRCFLEVKGLLDESVEKPRALAKAVAGIAHVLLMDADFNGTILEYFYPRRAGEAADLYWHDFDDLKWMRRTDTKFKLHERNVRSLKLDTAIRNHFTRLDGKGPELAELLINAVGTLKLTQELFVWLVNNVCTAVLSTVEDSECLKPLLSEVEEYLPECQLDAVWRYNTVESLFNTAVANLRVRACDV